MLPPSSGGSSAWTVRSSGRRTFGGCAQELLGEPDGVHDDRDPVACDLLVVVAVDVGLPWAEHEPEPGPLERAVAAAEAVERGEFGLVEAEVGFARDRARGFGEPVEPEPAVDGAALWIGGEAGRVQRLP